MPRPTAPTRTARELESHPDPAASYDEAAARIGAVAASEAGMDLQPEGRSIALLTGARSPKAVVIFHGYTAVPEQFRPVGQAYLAQGYNVWIPRLPHHGATDRMTTEFSRITPRGLREFADAAVDIGAGLGDELTVVGLSGGGALGVWAGFQRPEVEHTVLISPLMHPIGWKDWQLPLLVGAVRRSPVDRYAWWDPELKQANRAGYDYPRFSLKGISAFLALFQWVNARNRPPVTSTITLLRNDGDPRLDGAYNEAFARRLVPPDRLRVVTIPAEDGLGHDLVAWQPHSENYARLDACYRHLSTALGIPIPDPRKEC